MEDLIFFRGDNFRNSHISGVIKTEKNATISGCSLSVPVYNYVWIVGINKWCQLWVYKKKTRTESAFVLYCNYPNCACTEIPTLLPFLDRDAVHSGWITARTAQALEEQWHRAHLQFQSCLIEGQGSSSALTSQLFPTKIFECKFPGWVFSN